MKSKLIIIDGRTYNSMDEMPPDIRAQYEEALRNARRDHQSMLDLGNIDPFAAPTGEGRSEAFGNIVTVQGSSADMMNVAKFIVNGQTYDSLDQLPPEARAKYEQAMS